VPFNFLSLAKLFIDEFVVGNIANAVQLLVFIFTRETRMLALSSQILAGSSIRSIIYGRIPYYIQFYVYLFNYLLMFFHYTFVNSPIDKSIFTFVYS